MQLSLFLSRLSFVELNTFLFFFHCPILLFTQHCTLAEQRTVRLSDIRPTARPPHAWGDFENTREGHPSGQQRKLRGHRRQDGRVFWRWPRCGSKASGAVSDARKCMSHAPSFPVRLTSCSLHHRSTQRLWTPSTSHKPSTSSNSEGISTQRSTSLSTHAAALPVSWFRWWQHVACFSLPLLPLQQSSV